MENELTENDSNIIFVNIFFALLGIISSILPSIIVYFLWMFAKSMTQDIYQFLLVPALFYLMWFIAIFASVDAKQQNRIGILNKIIFNINFFATTILILFYIYILFKLI